MPEQDELDLDRLLRYTRSQDRELREDAMWCLANGSLHIPTEEVGEFFDQLLQLTKDARDRRLAVQLLCQWYNEFTEPGELMPEGYRERLFAAITGFAGDRDPGVSQVAQQALEKPRKS